MTQSKRHSLIESVTNTPVIKRTDAKLLVDALNSNGGGVDSDRYPEAARKRLLANGLIQWKPNQDKSKHYALLLTLTSEGKTVALSVLNTTILR